MSKSRGRMAVTSDFRSAYTCLRPSEAHPPCYAGSEFKLEVEPPPGGRLGEKARAPRARAALQSSGVPSSSARISTLMAARAATRAAPEGAFMHVQAGIQIPEESRRSVLRLHHCASALELFCTAAAPAPETARVDARTAVRVEILARRQTTERPMTEPRRMHSVSRPSNRTNRRQGALPPTRPTEPAEQGGWESQGLSDVFVEQKSKAPVILPLDLNSRRSGSVRKNLNVYYFKRVKGEAIFHYKRRRIQEANKTA